jgi:hypothetical protein
MGGMIEELIGRMAALLESLQATGDPRRYFHATYQRTTIAVAGELQRGGFVDPDWVERWDVAFADLYLDALQAALAGHEPTRPWAIAFGAPAYTEVLAQLEELSAAKVAALMAPGPVLLKLAATGFGVRLPDNNRAAG